MRAPTVRWPKWSAVLDAWNEHDVPNVETLSFEIGKQYDSLPWLIRSSGKQLVTNVSPNYWTARALCVEFPRMSADTRAAFKLLAFCWRYDIGSFTSGVLRQVPEFSRRGWWSAQAVYIFPPTDMALPTTLSSLPKYDEKPVARVWKEIVDAAATKWKLVAEEYAVIRIPDFMEEDSEERRAWEEYVSARVEAGERAEYERLKAKYKS